MPRFERARVVRRAWLRLVRRAARLRVASALAARWRGTRRPEPVGLESVRRRLELLVTALYGRPIPIQPAQRPRRRKEPALPGCDGVRIRLPATIDAADGDSAAALARYRLLAIEQAERVVRGTAALVPPASAPLERDLYLLREAALIDRSIAGNVRSAGAALTAARAAALGARPLPDSLTAIERQVEGLVRRVLTAGVTEPPSDLAAGAVDPGSPAESLAWARATAERLRAASARALGDGYRGLPPVSVWGTVTNAVSGGAAGAPSSGGPPDGAQRAAAARRSDAPAETPKHDQSSKRRNSSSLDLDRRRQLVELKDASPGGRTSPSDPPPDSSASSADATVITVDRKPGGDTPPWDVPAAPREPVPVGGIPYPEWDADHKRYRAAFVAVHHGPAPEAAASPLDVRREHAAVIRRVRERFERMQSRRTRMPRQRDGDELDLDACVSALVDSRRGRVPDDRVYVAVRPGRRPVAIMLLVDASGSASDQVSPTRTVIDVERVAVLLAGEALEALGDPYAILTFSSRGAAAVRVTSVKDFAERTSDRVRRRVSAIEPNGNTRLGAAVRHATALLARQPAGHRLLLVVSDGKPNDMDGYQGQYAVEDARQAIFEARAQGVVSFCLTVDREEPEYAPHIFGPAGYTLLRHPEQLPFVLLAAVRRLLAS